jgi:iron complex transport system substrate-binding protein
MKTKIVMLVGIALCTMLLMSPALASDAGTLEIYGNANEDDTIDMRDLTYVKLVFFGKKPETELADAKYDGKINPLDFIQIKLIIVGKEKELTVVDVAGRDVTIYKPVKRIIPLTTYSGEIIRMFGEQDKIVGVCSAIAEHPIYFPKLSELPSVGGTYPDYEVILRLNPDLVTAWAYGVEGHAEKLLGIPVVGLTLYKPEILRENLDKLGYIIDKEDKAVYYTNEFHDKYIDLIKAQIEGVSEEKRPKVYVESSSGAYKTYGSKSGAQQLIDIAGGKNIFADFEKIPKADPEEVVERNPDIIIKQIPVTDAGYDMDDPSKMKALRDELMNRPELANVNAVKNERVYIMDKDPWYGPDYPIAVAYMAKWFHPDLFGDLDPKAIHQEWLTEFQRLDYDLDKHGVFVYPEPS